jgi:hypothetical protein
VRCKTCHYSLANLTGPPHRCPECGTPFDPNDPSTFMSSQEAALHRSLDIQGRVLSVGWLIFIVCALIDWIVAPRAMSNFKPIAIAVMVAMSIWQVTVTWRRQGRPIW